MRAAVVTLDDIHCHASGIGKMEWLRSLGDLPIRLLEKHQQGHKEDRKASNPSVDRISRRVSRQTGLAFRCWTRHRNALRRL
jgi:hypothetical protein